MRFIEKIALVEVYISGKMDPKNIASVSQQADGKRTPCCTAGTASSALVALSALVGMAATPGMVILAGFLSWHH